MFTTTTITQSWPTPVHEDDGDHRGGLGVLTVFQDGEYDGCELVFPKYRMAGPSVGRCAPGGCPGTTRQRAIPHIEGHPLLIGVLRPRADGRIVFTPIEDEAFGRGYTFKAPTRFDKLFSGIAVPVPDIWKDEGPVGTEDIRPDETWDVDYGQLLERAVRRLTNRTEVASPPGFGGTLPVLTLSFTGELDHRRAG